MPRLVTKICGLLALLILLPGCMTQQVKTPSDIGAQPRQISAVSTKKVSPEDAPRMQAVEQAMQEADYDTASQLAGDLLKTYPNNAPLHINLGVIDLKLQRYDDALTHFNRGCELDPSNIHCPLFKGEALLALARYEDAETEYLRALSLDDTSLYAHYGLGVIYDLYLMKYDLAEDHYQAFIDGADEETNAEDVKRVKIWKRLLKRKAS